MIISESRIEEIISDTVKRTLERYHSADESPTSDTDTYAAAASIVVRPWKKTVTAIWINDRPTRLTVRMITGIMEWDQPYRRSIFC